MYCKFKVMQVIFYILLNTFLLYNIYRNIFKIHGNIFSLIFATYKLTGVRPAESNNFLALLTSNGTCFSVKSGVLYEYGSSR